MLSRLQPLQMENAAHTVGTQLPESITGKAGSPSMFSCCNVFNYSKQKYKEQRSPVVVCKQEDSNLIHTSIQHVCAIYKPGSRGMKGIEMEKEAEAGDVGLKEQGGKKKKWTFSEINILTAFAY